MLREMRMLEGCLVRAKDGLAGRVAEVLFDDEIWGVRYLLVDTGGRLPGRRVLMLPNFVEGVSAAMPASIRVRIAQRQVWESPLVHADRPVSARQEAAYYAHLYATSYWDLPVPVFPLYVDPEDVDPGDVDPYLRSAREARGYTIRTQDRPIGHVEDLIYDDEDWTVRYLIVDTRDWLPGKKVPVSVEWVTRISWSGAEVGLDLAADEIRSAPEWRPGTVIDRRYETELHAHYGRTPYWVRRQDTPRSRRTNA